jgi:hypothetical protein
MSEEPTVPLGLLRRYLAFHGWQRPERVTAGAFDGDAFADAFFRARAVGPRNFDLYVLSEPGLEDVELLLPRDIAAPEAGGKLAAAIDTLSQLKARIGFRSSLMCGPSASMS